MKKTFTQKLMLLSILSFTLFSLAAQSIWPGDISHNGRVNGVDYLYWGFAYQATGPERIPASDQWAEQSMGTPWAQHFPFNHNYAYADANGDGQVNPNDAELIGSYFRRSHGTPTADTLEPLPAFSLLQVTPIPLGQGVNLTNMTYTLDLKINRPVEKLYGFTFALQVPDGLLRDDNGILYNITSSSFLFPQSAAIRSFIHQDLTTDTYYVTVVKTDQEGMSGEGTIGQLILQLRPDLRLPQINFPVVLTFEEEVFVNDELRKLSAAMTNLTITRNDFTVGGCPSTVDPVCGSDGRTYLNSCYAEAAGVMDYTPGACFDNSCIDPTQIDNDATCTTEYDPVCGCNGVTYSNPCLADAAGVVSTTPGPCGTSDNCYDPQYIVTSSATTVHAETGVITVNCPTTYDPVCGCNGVTYTNACLAEASGIRVYTPGTCESSCIDPANINPDAQCTTEYDPVCGCNGVTYTNPCRAEAAGLATYTYGPCSGTSAWCDEAIPVQCGDFLANETTVGAGNNVVQYPGCSSNTFYGPDRVYVIEKTTIGDLQIGLEITTPGMDLDLFLLGDDCSQLTCLAKSTTDNSQTNNEGIIYEDAPLGTYYIVVDGQHASSQGTFRLEVSCGYLYCGNAVPLNCGQTYSGTNLNGNDDVSLYTCGTTLNVENNGPEVVHTFTTTQSGPVSISLTGLSANLELFLLDACDQGACIKYSQNAGTSNEYITDYLAAGTYYVVVDGYNGAVSDYNLHIDCTNACDLAIVNLSATASGCGQSSGSINITTSGGTPNYLISYSGPRSGSFTTSANSCNINYLPPGVYTITKTDASGCTVSGQVTVLGGSNLSVNLTPYDAVCMSGGRLGVYITNGQAPYTIRLVGPSGGTSTVNSNNFTVNDLDPGDYSVYITDYYGCTVSQQITIGQSSGDFLWNYTVTPAACGGYGAIHVNTYNGVAPYNISIQGPVSGGAVSYSSSFNIINLPGGTYQVTIEDGNWCQQTRTVVVPNESVSISLAESNGVCGQEGSIGVNISNGTPGYQISWSGPESGTANTVNGQYNITSLTAGTYTIAVTDYYGCTDTETVTLSTAEGGGLNANVIPLDGACGQNGALWVDIYDGVAPYTINWSGPESGVITTAETNFDVANLPCGNYQVVITDANGCDYYQTTTIGGCDNIDVNLTPVNGICGQEGSLLVSITGGSPVYTVSWTGPESGQTTTATNSVNIPTLVAGTYTVTVTGSGGCTDYAVTQISTSESNLVLQTAVSEAVCGAEGTIGLTVFGGVGPYQISWTGPESGVINTPNSNNTISNLSPGTYQLYVVDGNGCSKAEAVTIQNTGSDLNVSLVGNNGICNNFGNIGVNVFNGQAPYTIDYTGPITGNYSTNSNVSQIPNTPAGTYTVVVTDANGCSTSGTVQVSVQNNLVANLTPINGQCDSPGSIEVFISQGQPGFNISWTNGGDVNGATSIASNMYTITDLPSGNYSVVITDQAGCTRTLTTTIDNGNGNLDISASLIYNICGQYNTIWVDVIGGTPPFTVSWTGTENGSATTNTQGYEIMDLPPGTYKVTIVDANGCMTMQPDIIVYPAPVNIMTVTPFNGVCGEDGYLQVDITGGTGPYTLSWNGPSSGTQNYQGGTNIITNLPSGTYTLTLIDANGCSETETATLTNGGEPLEVTTALIYNDCGQYNTIWVDVVGGTPPYTVTWVELENGVETGTETYPTGAFEIFDLPPGTYKVTVVDVNGCMDMDTDIVIYPSPVNIFTASAQDGVCGQTGKINLDVTGGTGPYTLTYSGPISGTQPVPAGASVLTGFPSGTYTLTLTDANGCTETETVTINNTQGDPVTIQTSLIYNLCGQYNTIWVDVIGGTPPYTISWTGGENGSTVVTQPEFEIMDLPPGTYKVTVVDVNGCMDMQQDIIIYPAPVNIFSVATTNGECGGPGAITVNISAGTSPYTLQYSGPVSGMASITGNSFTLDPAPAGNYTFTLTDANGCTEVEQATVSTTEDGLELTATGENGNCITDPSITAQAAGGAGTYTLTWTGPESGSATIGSTPYTIGGLTPGTYTLTAEDGSSCSDTEQVTVAQPEDDLFISLTPTPGNCGAAGQIGVTIAGGSPDYTISWSGPSAGNVTISGSYVSIPNLASGTYTVSVTDSGGCTDVSTTNLQNGGSNVSVTATAHTGQCGAYGSISLIMGGGNGTYQLSWTGPTSGTRMVTGTTTELTNLLPGSYQITATSAGCSSSASVFLGTGTPALQISTSTSSAGCTDNGSIAVSLSGTQGSTTLSWTGPESGSVIVAGSSYIITDLAAGTYTLSATSGICSDTETATVGNSGENLTVTASPIAGVCGNDGSIILYINGGSAPYAIQWTGAENGSMTSNAPTVTIPNLRAGSYNIQVSSGTCVATAAANVSTSGNNLLITATPQAGTCLAPPAILVELAGGSAPYQLSWAGPSSGSASVNGSSYRIEDLTAGYYSLTVVDVNGCTRTTTTVLTDQDLAISLNGQDGTCGDNTVITVNISNGVGPYTIHWYGEIDGYAVSNQSAYSIYNLPGGTYQVTVEDINGCMASGTVTVESGATDFYVRHMVSDNGCGMLNNIWMDFYNGQAPYHIEWIGPESGFINVDVDGYDITELPSGYYIIIVTDATGCIDVQQVEVVNMPNDLEATFSPQNGSCGSNGSIGVHVTGGTPTYTVSWYLNGQPVSVRFINGNYFHIGDLVAGNYLVIVEDDGGCEQRENFVITTGATEMQLDLTTVAPGCNNDGSIGVNFGGGQPPFQVQWSGAASGSATTDDYSYIIAGLDGGSYTVSVTDANGCSGSAATTVYGTTRGDVHADFYYQEDELTVNFINESTNGLYFWDFGDGTQITTYEENISHTFPNTGTYQVCLRMTEPCGTDIHCESITVESMGEQALLDIGENTGGSGSTISLPVTLQNADNIISLAGSVNVVNEAVGQLVSVTPGVIAPQFNAANQTFSYFSNGGSPIYFSDDEVLFYFNIQLTGTSGQRTTVEWTQWPLPIEIGTMVNGEASTMPYTTSNGEAMITDVAGLRGVVTTFWNEPLADTEISIVGPGYSASMMTDEAGAYDMPDLTSGMEYTVSASREGDHANGLSTYALFIGQRFLLGMEPEQIYSPYQVVAGDANCNDAFTTLDLFLIQRLIIGAAAEFTSCPAWTFVSDVSEMPDDFDAYNVFPYVNSHPMMLMQPQSADYVGVKVGDILGEAYLQGMAPTGGYQVDRRGSGLLTFRSANPRVSAGEEVTLYFTSEEFADIVSYQFGLQFPADQLEFLEFLPATTAPFQTVVAGDSQAAAGKLRLSWFSLDGEGHTAATDTPLFGIRFRALQEITDFGAIMRIDPAGMRPEAFDATEQNLLPTLDFNNEVTSTEDPLADRYTLYQNVPNPVSAETLVGFYLPEASTATLTLRDAFGKTVWTQTRDYQAGQQQVKIDGSGLAAGVYHYSLQAGSFRATKSLVVVR